MPWRATPDANATAAAVAAPITVGRRCRRARLPIGRCYHEGPTPPSPRQLRPIVIAPATVGPRRCSPAVPSSLAPSTALCAAAAAAEAPRIKGRRPNLGASPIQPDSDLKLPTLERRPGRIRLGSEVTVEFPNGLARRTYQASSETITTELWFASSNSQTTSIV